MIDSDGWRTGDEGLPEVGVPIEVDWLGTVFQATFISSFQPWGTAWDLDIDYFGRRQKRLVGRGQIKRWRYRDRS